MPDNLVSIDEYLTARKSFVQKTAKGDAVVKGFRSAPSWDASKRTARFTMSSEREDRDKDIVLQGGMDIEEFKGNPAALYGHQSYGAFPIGNWKDVEKNLTGRPKRLEGTLQLLPEGDDPTADRVAVHLGRGTLRTCSIGFIAKAVKRRDRPEGTPADSYVYTGYEIVESELVECSVVCIPSNRDALIKGHVESIATLPREVVEEILDTWERTPSGLLVERKAAEAAYATLFGGRASYYRGLDYTEAKGETVSAIAPNDGERVGIVVTNNTSGPVIVQAKTAADIAAEAVEAELATVEKWAATPTDAAPDVKGPIAKRFLDTLRRAVGIKTEAEKAAEAKIEADRLAAEAAERAKRWGIVKERASAVLQ